MSTTSGSTDPFHNIIIFGAGGKNIGFHIARILSEDPTFSVTVLARNSSQSTYPSNVQVRRVSDDLPHAELVEALRGQDVLISAIGHAAKKTEYQLVQAALEAGVKRFFPTEYGLDNSDPKNAAHTPIFGVKYEFQQFLKSKQKEGLSWTAVATGMWLDWALSPGMTFTGIDVAAHTVAYWTHGDTHTPSWSTLSFAAQGVVEAVKHPRETENKVIFVRAFEASQQQIVRELEKQQKVQYKATEVDAQAVMKEAKAQLVNDKDDAAAYTLVQAAFLLPEFGTDFVKAKKDIADEYMTLPTISLEEVVKDVLTGFP